MFSSFSCSPSLNPCISQPSLSPSRSPSKEPTKGPSLSSSQYCGCPECTQSVWDTPVTDGGGTFTCGDRIAFKQSSAGGGLSLSEACVFVSDEFPGDQCGPMCNSDTCTITPAPTAVPSTSPSKEVSQIFMLFCVSIS